MTPAEFHAVLEARTQDREDSMKFQDQLNAKLCEIVAKAPYLLNPWERSPEDFRILSGGPAEAERDMTPDAILARAFGDLSGSG